MHAQASDSVLYVRELLTRFGVRIYLGKRKWELELMEEELDELFESRLLGQEEYVRAKRILARALKELSSGFETSVSETLPSQE